jgi:hypothetical protein
MARQRMRFGSMNYLVGSFAAVLADVNVRARLTK